MKRDSKEVAYAFEYGDETLPHIKDLISEKPDPEKEKILTYLKTHCIIACAGIFSDEIDPEKVIGYGNVFSDGTYIWNDVFYNYVDRYNIPVPKEFREHLLNNFEPRMKRHEMLGLVDSVEIQNNPYLGFRYIMRIYRNGVIKYQNNTDCPDETVLYIKPEDADYIIDSIMTELFCYDADGHGTAMVDGYHWKLVFYEKDKIVEEIEGWPGEDCWRYGEMERVMGFVERCVGRDMGVGQFE